MKSEMYAFVVGIFEFPGEYDAALNYVMSKLKNDSVVHNIKVQEVELTQWSDPFANEKIKISRDGKTFNKFTMNFQIRFDIDGLYAESQNWVVKKFTEEEELTHMNIQMVRLSGGVVTNENTGL